MTQPFDDHPTGGIGERLEDPVELVMLKHVLKYCHLLDNVKGRSNNLT